MIKSLSDRYNNILKIHDEIYFKKCGKILKGKIYYMNFIDNNIAINYLGYKFIRYSNTIVLCNSEQSLLFLLENV